MKIELSKELTQKAREIGATHYDIALDCLLKVSGDDVCYYSEGDQTGKWVGGLVLDDLVVGIDFDPPKSELLAEIERLKAALDKQWLPIESAPRDENYFIGYQETYGVNQSFFCKDEGRFRNLIHGWRPTHWQPLPLKPKGE